LGIEAARKKILQEIVYTMSVYGINLDVRHVQLAAETMTFKGKVHGFTRFGVDKLKNSTLYILIMLFSIECLLHSKKLWRYSLMQQYKARRIV